MSGASAPHLLGTFLYIIVLTSNDNTVDLFLRLFHLFAIALVRTLYPTLAWNNKI